MLVEALNFMAPLIHARATKENNSVQGEMLCVCVISSYMSKQLTTLLCVVDVRSKLNHLTIKRGLPLSTQHSLTVDSMMMVTIFKGDEELD